MNGARWLALVAVLLCAFPANAQQRKTRLNDHGRAVVEATASDVAACKAVYRWDRCRQPTPTPGAVAQPSPQRRLDCIASARNVAAKKGATHYRVEGHVFTGYRCAVSSPPPYVAALVAPVSASEGAEEKARYKALGFVAWGGACTGVGELFSDGCAGRPSIQAQVSCREVRARALMEAERIYYLPDVDTRIDHDRKTGTYRIHFKGVLDRLGAPGDQRYLTVGSLVTARRGTTTEALADAARPFGDLVVQSSALKEPTRFKRQVLVEALVRPKSIHAPVANNPARISAIESEVVGLRAYLPDLSWGAVVIPPPEGFPHYSCKPLERQAGDLLER